MGLMIQISDSEIEEMSEHVEQMLKHGGRLMSCIEKLSGNDDVNYRRGNMGNRYSMGYRETEPRRMEDREYDDDMGMRRSRDSRGRYM